MVNIDTLYPHDDKKEDIRNRLVMIDFLDLLDVKQTAIYLNMSKSWLDKGRARKREQEVPDKKKFIPTPKYITLPNGRIRYRKEDLENWKKMYGAISDNSDEEVY